MDPVTLIALAIMIAVGVPMMSYIGYKLHERLEEEGQVMAATSTSTTTATSTTTTTTKEPPKRSRTRRQKTKKMRAKWALIPMMVATAALAGPGVEAWAGAVKRRPTIQAYSPGPALPLIAVAATLTALTINNTIY